MGSDFLFTMPSFATGVARLVDLFGEVDDYNYAPTPGMADAMAMRADWQAVGDDLRNATEGYRDELDAQQLQLFDEQPPRPAAAR